MDDNDVNLNQQLEAEIKQRQRESHELIMMAEEEQNQRIKPQWDQLNKYIENQIFKTKQ